MHRREKTLTSRTIKCTQTSKKKPVKQVHCQRKNRSGRCFSKAHIKRDSRCRLQERITGKVSLRFKTETRSFHIVKPHHRTCESAKMNVSLLSLTDIFSAYKVPAEKLAGHGGTLTVLSKVGGWMTVTPRRQSRREPIDKEQMSKNGVFKITDQRRISGLSPVWMHD